MHKHKLTGTESGRRLDKFLHSYLPHAENSLIHKLLRKKRIKLNGAKAEPHNKLAAGDELGFYLAPETLARLMGEKCVPKPASPPEIIYEDENILVLNKPAGLLCHTGYLAQNRNAGQSEQDTLIGRVLYYLHEKGEIDGAFTPALCNRLDRNTAGLVIAGKNAIAMQRINEAFKTRSIEKIYYAEVCGRLEGKAVLQGCWQKDSRTNKALVRPITEGQSSANNINENAKDFVRTEYESVSHTANSSILKIKLITGRSHQIRAHMAAIGHPLMGDTKYGGGPGVYKLCCYSLKFLDGEGLRELDYLAGVGFAAYSEKNNGF